MIPGDLITPAKQDVIWEYDYLLPGLLPLSRAAYGCFRLRSRGTPLIKVMIGQTLSVEQSIFIENPAACWLESKTWAAGEVFGLLLEKNKEYIRVNVAGTEFCFCRDAVVDGAFAKL
jgi:hypothetical protein